MCPRLKYLVMPAWDKLKKKTICTALHAWKDVESFIMPSSEEPAYVIKKICKNISEVKNMTPLRHTICICTCLICSKLESFECEAYGLI